MQYRKVRKGICTADLNDVELWNYNYSAAQKAMAQRFHLISSVVIISALVKIITK